MKIKKISFLLVAVSGSLLSAMETPQEIDRQPIPALYRMPAEMQNLLVQEILRGSNTPREAVGHVKKIIYADPHFESSINEAFLNRTMVLFGRRFNTRNYVAVARALDVKCKPASPHRVTDHWHSLLVAWKQHYDALIDAVEGQHKEGVRKYVNEGFPVDGIVADLVDNFDLAKSNNDEIWKLETLTQLAIMGCMGEGASGAVLKAMHCIKLREVCEAADRQAIKNAIAETTDINYQDKDGETILWTAVYYNNLIAVEELLAAGADTNKPNSKGISLLMETIDDDNGPYQAIVAKLVAAGADFTVKDRYGYSALDSIKTKLSFRCRDDVRRNREAVLVIFENAMKEKELKNIQKP